MNCLDAVSYTHLVVFPHYEGNESKGFILKEQILHEGKNTDLMELYKATFRQKLNEPWKKIFRADILLNNDVKFPTDMYMGEDLCCVLYTSRLTKLSISD